MSETIEIIGDIIAEVSCIPCSCNYNSYACSFEENNGKYYIEYECSECFEHKQFRWIPRQLNADDGICRSTDLLVPQGTEIYYSSDDRPYYYDETCEKTRWAEYEEVINDEDDEGDRYKIDFNLLRCEILSSRRKFVTLKAFLEYFEMDYEIRGYTIPQIYEQLKNKNYVRSSDYILYKLGEGLFK